MSLMMSGTEGISAFPDGDNLFLWIATIHGATSTPYQGLKYKLSIKFSPTYPFNPPKIKFISKCYHPNVDSEGNICLDILQDKWSAIYNVQTILLSIQSLLGEPNNDSPLNIEAAQLWDHSEDFISKVKESYSFE